MRNYIAAVFDDSRKAYEALRQLWDLDGRGDIAVHGTGVVHRDELGFIQVDTKETHPALGTAIGVGVGALLGLWLDLLAPQSVRPEEPGSVRRPAVRSE